MPDTPKTTEELTAEFLAKGGQIKKYPPSLMRWRGIYLGNMKKKWGYGAVFQVQFEHLETPSMVMSPLGYIKGAKEGGEYKFYIARPGNISNRRPTPFAVQYEIERCTDRSEEELKERYPMLYTDAQSHTTEPA